MSFLEAELARQPDDWHRAGELAGRFAEVLPQPGERVAMLGCGSSWFVGQAYASLREVRGRGLTDAWSAGDHRLHRGYDRVVAVTRSGTTSEVVDVLRQWRGKVPTTVLTCLPDSPVGELADVVVPLEVTERSVVQTSSATTALAVLRAGLGEDLSPVADLAAAALGEDEADLAPLRRAEQVTFLGAGWAAALASEAALKLRESAQMWVESHLASEYRHGPVSLSGPGRAVWALGTLPPGLAEEIAATEAHLEWRDVDPMAELVRVHRLAALLALDRGLDPDRPRHLSYSVTL